jgi:hypothetical protein
MMSHLRPNIDIQAKSPQTGKVLTAQLSNADASFVNGVFSQAAVQTSGSGATGATSASGAAAAASQVTTAKLVSTVSIAPQAILVDPANFRVPGITLGIFPTGLIITSIWCGFFILAVGFGTLGRIQFREQYRRRSKRAGIANVRTI